MKDMRSRHTTELTMKCMKKCEALIFRVRGSISVYFKPFVLFMVETSF